MGCWRLSTWPTPSRTHARATGVREMPRRPGGQAVERELARTIGRARQRFLRSRRTGRSFIRFPAGLGGGVRPLVDSDRSRDAGDQVQHGAAELAPPAATALFGGGQGIVGFWPCAGLAFQLVGSTLTTTAAADIRSGSVLANRAWPRSRRATPASSSCSRPDTPLPVAASRAQSGAHDLDDHQGDQPAQDDDDRGQGAVVDVVETPPTKPAVSPSPTTTEARPDHGGGRRRDADSSGRNGEQPGRHRHGQATMAPDPCPRRRPRRPRRIRLRRRA